MNDSLIDLQSEYSNLKVQLTKIQFQTNELESKLSEKEEIIAKLEEDQETKTSTLEAMNLMTKYQIVFLKLESSVQKISATIQAWNEIWKWRAFEKFRVNSKANSQVENYKAIYLGWIFLGKLK